jgi:type I restriction enzyme S subunit
MMGEEIKNIGLPTNWHWTELKNLVDDPKNDIVDGPFGSNLKSIEYVNSGIPVFKIQNIKANSFVDKNIIYVTEEKAKQLKRHTFQKGDLIITKLGDPLGLCCKVPEKYDFGVIVADLIRLRPSPSQTYDKYLIYGINSVLVQSQFKAITKGTTRARVNLTIVRSINFPLAPLPEQRAIVAKIEKLFSDLDNGIANLKAAKAKLDIYRQAVLKKAFEGELTKDWLAKQSGLPKGWKWVRLGDISILNPRIKDKSMIDDDLIVQFVPMKFVDEIVDKIHLVETRKFIEVQKKSYTYFEEGDVLFAKVTPCMENGKIAVARNLKNGIGYGSSEFHVFRCLENLINNYLFYFLVQTKFRKDAQHAMTGAVGLRRVPKSFLEQSLIPLPSLQEQHAIVAAIESRLSVCDKLAESIDQSLEKAQALRQSILKKAFEGKLLSQAELAACRREPDWEPAAKLLERIQKDKSGRPTINQVKNR